MEKFQYFRATLMIFSALSLAAYASNPEIAVANDDVSQLSSVDEDVVIALPPKKEKSLVKRLAKGAIGGTVSAVKGTARVATGAVKVTAEGAGLVAKGTVAGAKVGGKVVVAGAKAGGKAAVDTGEIIVYGTRKTAGGLRDGLGFITKAPAVNDAASPVGYKTLTDAALAPLTDLNIRRRERPEILMRLADEDVYHIDDNAGCEWYDVRIQELDDVLGDDYDAPKEDKSTLKKIGEGGHSVALYGIASTTSSPIPGRGIVRVLSGSKARKRETRKIYQKGVARRSFIKGVAVSDGCSDTQIDSQIDSQ